MGKKISTSGILIITLPVITLFAGIFIGTKIKVKKDRNATLTVTPSATEHTYSHLNPLTGCFDYSGRSLIMRELRWFRPELDAYITKAQRKNPDIHVSYYFRDLTNGMWIGINEKEEFTPASLLKLPIMIAALKEAEKNPSMLAVRVQYVKKDFEGVEEEAGFKKEDGKYYTMDELITQMVDYSDNAAALIILKYIGEDKVVEVEKSLNLSIPKDANPNTNFVRIKDYASILRVLFNASYLNRDMSEKALVLLSGAGFKQGIRAGVPDSVNVAHKYGVRDMHDANGRLRPGYQLHHFGIVYYPGKPFILGIMTRGGTREEKEQLVKDLTTITYLAVDKQLKQLNNQVVIEKH